MPFGSAWFIHCICIKGIKSDPNVILTIASTTALEINLTTNKLLVTEGTGVLIKDGGTLRQTTGTLSLPQHLPETPTRELSVTTATSTTYHHTDHLGSTAVDTDTSGQMTYLADYYPYGSTRYQEGTQTNPYTYTGKEEDSATNLFYYGARYYDGSVGRFMQVDPAFLAVGCIRYEKTISSTLNGK